MDHHPQSSDSDQTDCCADLAAARFDLADSRLQIQMLARQLSDAKQAADAEKRAATDSLQTLKSTFSWRITAPLRFLGGVIQQSVWVSRRIVEIFRRDHGPGPLVRRILDAYHDRGIAGIRSYVKMGRINAQVERHAELHVDLESSADGAEASMADTAVQDIFWTYQKNPPVSSPVRLIAFYLPQFHPFPENDEWWGKGFTEWTNVGKAKPNYAGHYQPHCPIHFGYYDLRVAEVMEEQARLAKEFGIHGFSYYFYWFGGKTLMETPLKAMLANKNVDMPFCLTWANENWSRRWDGLDNEILISQRHSKEDSLAFIRHLIQYFRDERYIRIDEKPVLIVYRADIIPDISQTAQLWQEELIREGFPGLYLISAQTFGIRSPEPFGFDASVEFPPHTASSEELTTEVDLTNRQFSGRIFSYSQVVRNAIKRRDPDYKLFRTAMLSWDNTARKQNNSHIFHGFNLANYKRWLTHLIQSTSRNEKFSPEENLVFVNAWNEWAEGTHLEPDQKIGYGYLQATYDAIKDSC